MTKYGVRGYFVYDINHGYLTGIINDIAGQYRILHLTTRWEGSNDLAAWFEKEPPDLILVTGPKPDDQQFKDFLAKASELYGLEENELPIVYIEESTRAAHEKALAQMRAILK